MSYSKEALAQYRIDRAMESIDEARILAEKNHWNTTVSRLYYACFYVASAYLITNNIKAGTHNGVKTAFNKELIKTAIIPKEYGLIYSRLFNLRQDADYRDFRDFSEHEISPLIEAVEMIVEELVSIIKGHGRGNSNR
ncbi:HEPN domain-containing protein [Phaeodactylibacter xiamenensis]|uniref:HEPN domain-containing protein n=1 Tax=Phaeodactylibacter xiamenensis TaxID=1524460 RepID=UPI003BAC294A